QTISYIDTLSLHDALPISGSKPLEFSWTKNGNAKLPPQAVVVTNELESILTIETVLLSVQGLSLAPIDPSSLVCGTINFGIHERSEEHTSELQSRFDLVCR